MGGNKIDVGGSNKNGSSPSLTWWGLGAIAFVMTSCGPFGLEATMYNGGAMLTLIAVLVVPILYVIPQVLMVSELALMMPSNHGYILWVQRGWGPFAGFFNGYNAVIVNTVDLALYPVLASDYVVRLFGRVGWLAEGETVGNFDFTNRTYLVSIATRLSLIAIGTFVGCLSTANVSSISVIVCFIVAAVFIILFCIVLPDIDIKDQATYTAGLDREFTGPQWGPFTAAALWLYTGWNSLGSLAGDVDNGDSENSEEASAAEDPLSVIITDKHAGGAGGPLAPLTALSDAQQRDLEATAAHHAARGVDGYCSPTISAAPSADEGVHKAAHAGGGGGASHVVVLPPEILTQGDLALDRSPVSSALALQRDDAAAGSRGPKEAPRREGGNVVASDALYSIQQSDDHTLIKHQGVSHEQTPTASDEMLTSSGSAIPKEGAKDAGLNNVFVRGLQFALVLGVILYLLPLLTALTSEEARSTPWGDGFLVAAMDMAVPGSFWVLIVIGILSQFGLYYSSLVCYSRIVWGLAELGWLPAFFARLNGTNGTPINATLAQSAALVPLMFFDFSYLQRLEFTLAAIAYCLTFSAFLRLRYTEKDTHRPYTVPGGLPIAWLITATKVVVMVTVAATNAADPILLGVTVGINGVIGVAYYFSDGRKRAKELEEKEKNQAKLDSEEPLRAGDSASSCNGGRHHTRAHSSSLAAAVDIDTSYGGSGGRYAGTRQSEVEMGGEGRAANSTDGYGAESPRCATTTEGEEVLNLKTNINASS